MSDRAAELRRDFDASFALPPAPSAADTEAFLLIRAGTDTCALRVRDVSHFTVDRPITPVPGRRPELLGLAGLRGAAIPVYSLARLLGAAVPPDPPRWLAVTGEIGLAFEGFDRFVRRPADRVRRLESPRRHVDELLQDGPLAAAVVNLSSIRRTIIGRETR